MAIITQAEVKTLLQISVTTYDTLISTLIPIVQDKINNYCGNSFVKTDIYVAADTMAFVSGTPATITDSDSGFVTGGFTNSIDISVVGSKQNDGVYAVDTTVAGTLTLATGETLVTEAAGNDIVITRVIFPKGIKTDVADYIGYLMITSHGVSSESLGDYSVTYKSEKDILKRFNIYRAVNFE